MLGYSMALGCAMIWSLSVVMFKKSGQSTHPVVLNLLKNTLGLLLFIPTTILLEGGIALPGNEASILLFLSGFIGIGISDYFVLKALSHMGAGKLAILECLYSPFVITLSILFLGESLGWGSVVGALMILGAIILVSLQKASVDGEPEQVFKGALWGASGLFGMAVGIVMVKPIFPTMPLFTIITLRMGAGVLSSLLVYLTLPNKKTLFNSFLTSPNKPMILLACVLSTYVAMAMWVAGFKFNDAIVAAILNQTSTIFTVIFATILLKEKLTPARTIGTLLAFGGVLIITIS